MATEWPNISCQQRMILPCLTIQNQCMIYQSQRWLRGVLTTYCNLARNATRWGYYDEAMKWRESAADMLWRSGEYI